MAKFMFLIISAIVCVIIFYANTSVIGRRSLFALFMTKEDHNGDHGAGAAAYSNNADEDIGENRMIKAGQDEEETTLPLNEEDGEGEQQQNDDWIMSSTTSRRPRKSLIMKTILLRPPTVRNASVQIYNLAPGGGGAPEHISTSTDYNIFVIYTKENYQLHVKFELFAKSLLKFANSGMLLHLHVLTDETSGHSVEQILESEIRRYRRSIIYSLYSMHLCAEQVMDIVNTMTPYFSSTPKSYYSDALFFLSLGLHRIADENMERAILLDCDIVFRADVRLLFNEFEKFAPDHLFGLAPELTPVYRHILYRYRANYPQTDFGSPFYLPPSQQQQQQQAQQQHPTTLPHNMRSCRSSTASGSSTSKSSTSEDQGIAMMTSLGSCGTAVTSPASPFHYNRCCADIQRASGRSASDSSATGAKPKKNFWKIKP
uniref:Glycosyl transferase n=1 Tax=Musca domestica TaxID=7370 RepID=T1PL38_MUSDO